MAELQKLRRLLSGWGERVLRCHNPECTGTRRAWERISSGAGSVCVHSLRFCFPACFERELQVRFERLQSAKPIRSHSTRRVPLGLLMLSRGRLSHVQLRRALEEQRRSGLRIGECLQRLGYAHEPQITATLALQWGCPVIRRLPQSVLNRGVPVALLRKFQMVPVHFSASARVLYLAFASEVDYPVLIAIEQMLDCNTAPCLTTPTLLQSAFDRMGPDSGYENEKEFAGGRGTGEMVRISSSYAGKLDAKEVRIASCNGIAWVRIEGVKETMDLLFQMRGEPECPSASPRWR